MKNIRKLVYLSLLSCRENGRYSNLEADSVIERNALGGRDKALYTAMLYGTLERQITIDYQIKKLSKTPIEKLQIKVLLLLRLGLYQLLYMNSVPNHAAVNETVTLAKQYVNPAAVSYINGILRNASSSLKKDGKITLFTPDKEKDICGYLSITYSFPRFLCKLWVKAYGEAAAEKIMSALNKKKTTTIRVNTLKTDRASYLTTLKQLGYEAISSNICDDGIQIIGNAPITSLPGFDDGYFFVQDDASRLCVSALNPKENECILDACACPGGKSFAIALQMNNKGKIVSCDLHESKLSLIVGGAKRLGIGIIEVKQTDSSAFNPEFENKFDRVLCDVPCSGFGTIAKKPDLRLKTPDTVNNLPEIQLSIVNNCSKYVKKGGVLVYSTCTLNHSENEENVRKFLSQNPNFSLLSEKSCFPFEAEYDGFYFAKMIRNN